MKKDNADIKSHLIDLEADNTATGGKQEFNSVQPERLSDGNNYCVYWIHNPNHNDKLTEGYIGITFNFKERMRAHKKNKKKSKLTDAIKSYEWNNLQKDILFNNLTLKEALNIEKNFRPLPSIGWNIQVGGELGVDKEWYDIPENKLKHSINTSVATKKGIKEKDSTKARSKRARISRIKNADSYINVFVGSKNPRALLNENKVKEIKCKLIPSGMKLKEIAELYNVGKHVISFIKTGKNWKHVVCDSPDYK